MTTGGGPQVKSGSRADHDRNMAKQNLYKLGHPGPSSIDAAHCSKERLSVVKLGFGLLFGAPSGKMPETQYPSLLR